MAIQGKCTKCKRRYTWDRDLKMSLTECPACNSRLQATTHLSELKHVILTFTPRRNRRFTYNAG